MKDAFFYLFIGLACLTFLFMVAFTIAYFVKRNKDRAQSNMETHGTLKE